VTLPYIINGLTWLYHISLMDNDIWYGHISPLMSHVSPLMRYGRVIQWWVRFSWFIWLSLCLCFLMFVFKIKLTMYMYHDILFINKHIVWRSIYVSAYPHYSCKLKSRSRKVFSRQRLQGTCDKSVVFSEIPVSSTNKTEIFLKVAVNTIKLKHG
jgi:hypothetical protein